MIHSLTRPTAGRKRKPLAVIDTNPSEEVQGRAASWHDEGQWARAHLAPPQVPIASLWNDVRPWFPLDLGGCLKTGRILCEDETDCCIQVLDKLFPGLRSGNIFLQDLIKKKYAITDAFGNRLSGDEPYKNDPFVSVCFPQESSRDMQRSN